MTQLDAVGIEATFLPAVLKSVLTSWIPTTKSKKPSASFGVA
jgi:hypothetical protein